MNPSLNLRVLFNLLILFLASAIPVFSQDGAGAFPFSKAPYEIGERLTYDVSFSNFLSAAHVELKVVSRGVFADRDAIQLKGHVKTSGVVNVALLSINNDYTTYIEPETGIPFQSQEVIRDAIRTNDVVIDFNQPAGTGAIPSTRSGIPGTYDFLSAFFRIRALPLTRGSSYEFQVRGQAREYNLQIKVVGSEVVRTNVGSFTTIVTSVRVSGDSPVKDAKVYFSDDDRHVPVLMTARVSKADLRVELAGSEVVKPAGANGSASPTPIPTPTATPTPTPRPTPRATPTPVQVLRPLEWPFTSGEQLNYQVFIGSSNTALGIATFQVRGRSQYFDKDGLYLTVKAYTTGAAAKLFVANDTIESYVDTQSLLPYRTIFNLSEGRRRFNQTLVVDQNRGLATTDKGERIDIPVGTHDYLSLFYAVRSLNLSPPKRNAVSILAEGKPKTMFITATKRETIEIGQQKLQAIALTLTTDDPQSDKYQLRIWISNDARRIPLRITAQTELGPLRADLAIVPTNSQ